MKKDLWRLWGITFFGFWIGILPVLGFPRGLKSTLFFLSGITVAALSFFTAKSFTHNYIHHDDTEESTQ